MKKISVIIPVKNDEQGIRRTLNSLRNFNFFEIIVVDNNSTDKTVKIVKKFKKVKLLHENYPSSYACRNKGIWKSKGDIIVLMDSGVWIDENWTLPDIKENIILGFNVKNVRLVKNIYSLYSSLRHFPIKKHIVKDNFIPTICVAIKSSTFKKYGVFDKSYFSGGDREFCQRLISKGYQLKLSEESVFHEARYTFFSLIKRWFRVGRGFASLGNLNFPSKNSILIDNWCNLSFKLKIKLYILYLVECLVRLAGFIYYKYVKF